MALTERYVRADAAGGGDGTTDANSGANGAFTWAEMITDINTPRVGYRYNVKSGTYANGATSTIPTGDGTTTSPNVIQGFNATIGDLDNLGRAVGGALVTTNFPSISYTGTSARIDASGSNYLLLANLIITSAASNATITLGSYHRVTNCKISNTGTNAVSAAIACNGDDVIQNCDLETATTGATYAIRSNVSGVVMIGCRVKCTAGAGFLGRSTLTLINNTFYECTTGISVDLSTSTPFIIGNTIANCTGDGIDIITATTTRSIIVGNHITGCGGYGIDYNTSTCHKYLGYNRFRDNASGNVNGGGDWESGTSTANVTSDDTDALDFVDQSTDDYALKAGAAAISKGLGYLIDIGAHGTPIVSSSGGVAAGSFIKSGSGRASTY